MSGLTGVILLQLGTPQSPDPAAVRRYLAEFLADPMVIDLPRYLWLPILYGIILPFRPKRSARLYQKIWMENGRSPLLHYSLIQAEEMQRRLGPTIPTRLAMRYGQPALDDVLRDLHHQGVKRLLVLPLFPQYSRTTSGSGIVKVFQSLSQFQPIPALRIAQPFHDHPRTIAAWAARIRTYHPPRPGRHYLFSFHGLPQRIIDAGDPYHDHCTRTANLIAQAIPLDKNQWTMTFQSRFGPQKWLEPNTKTLLQTLPTQGITDCTVVCPGFVADCLETLEEIAMAGQETFIHHGGITFGFVPCLNDSPEWLSALHEIIQNELSGWQ
ncbi:MAG: ferrochelatase [Nitrospirae bacterium]|nr:ferrochelatase [Magnetococcales bacterium]HAT50146.1 ferrochelatase [Alphaproteobacteria bacterium]